MASYKCNLIVAGVGKSGTSSLHTYLDAHPEICMSSVKEPHFFSIDKFWGKGVSFHNKLFSCVKPHATVFGESSTTYFASELAIKRINQSLGEARILIVLRDPVERTISHYRWMFALGIENRPFLQAIEQSGYNFDPNVSIRGNYMSYLEFSLYSKWVPRWQASFGANNVLIIRTDELKASPELVINNCCSFLGVSNFTSILPAEQNRTDDLLAKSESRVSALIKAGLPSPVKRTLKVVAPGLVNKWNKMFIKTYKRVPPKITEEEIKKVAFILKDELQYFLSTKHDSIYANQRNKK